MPSVAPVTSQKGVSMEPKVPPAGLPVQLPAGGKFPTLWSMVTNGFFPIQLVERIQEYSGVCTLRFRAPDPVSFVPGQYAHVLAPASPPGRENVRHLSIASIPAEGFLQFSVDLASASDYKKKLAALQVGEEAHLFKVKGEFVLATPLPPKIVFLAGGLGITPVRSLLKQIVHDGLPVAWSLIHVAREKFLYQEEIEAWGGVQVRIGRPELGPVLSRAVNDAPEALYYISGSARFVEGMAGTLRGLGVPDGSLRVEDFR
jgi:ferredoxin-NADP reductase